MVRSQSDASRRWMGFGVLDSTAMPALLINLQQEQEQVISNGAETRGEEKTR
jgi:hypothetical protein